MMSRATRRDFLAGSAALVTGAGLAGLGGHPVWAAEPPVEAVSNRRINVVLLADKKDHGPSGNGLHDYPLWQRQWSLLLGADAPSKDQQPDTAQHRDGPSLHVAKAWHWPSGEQFEAADVIVAYCYLDWNEDRLAQVRQYLENGGGLALIHSATWPKPKPSRDVAELVGIGGFPLYRHGRVELDVTKPGHPICSGLPKTIVLENDETYWPPVPMLEGVAVLATSVEKQGSGDGATRSPQPMFWCYTLRRGRVFGCVPGHCMKTFDDPLFRTLLLRGTAWAAGEEAQLLDALAKSEVRVVE
jgi:type 1 glutamine amidotransferase